MPFALDVFSSVHLGRLRTGPPATGAEPQRDDLLRAHVGRFLIDDGLSFVGIVDDETFCIVKSDERAFEIVARDDGVFCVVKTDDDEVFL